MEGLNLEEFFFLLSLTGLLPPLRDGPEGDQVSVHFLRQRGKQKKPKLEDFI